jgi:hypothetical protein
MGLETPGISALEGDSLDLPGPRSEDLRQLREVPEAVDPNAA